MKKYLIYFFLFILSFSSLTAQDSINKVSSKTFSADSGIIDTLSKDGKIYIVITVIAIILIGIFAYLFRIEKKISKLEKQNNL